MDKKIVFWSGIMPLIVLALTLMIFFIFHNNEQEKIFYFFEQGTEKTVGEIRTIPKYHENEKNVQVYIEELFLGPRGMNMMMVFPEGTRLNHIMLRGKKLYIDINNMILGTDIIKNYNIGKSIDLFRENILFNFPYISEIIFTITGEEPDIAETEKTDLMQ